MPKVEGQETDRQSSYNSSYEIIDTPHHPSASSLSQKQRERQRTEATSRVPTDNDLGEDLNHITASLSAASLSHETFSGRTTQNRGTDEPSSLSRVTILGRTIRVDEVIQPQSQPSDSELSIGSQESADGFPRNRHSGKRWNAPSSDTREQLSDGKTQTLRNKASGRDSEQLALTAVDSTNPGQDDGDAGNLSGEVRMPPSSEKPKRANGSSNVKRPHQKATAKSFVVDGLPSEHDDSAKNVTLRRSREQDVLKQLSTPHGFTDAVESVTDHDNRKKPTPRPRHVKSSSSSTTSVHRSLPDVGGSDLLARLTASSADRIEQTSAVETKYALSEARSTAENGPVDASAENLQAVKPKQSWGFDQKPSELVPVINDVPDDSHKLTSAVAGNHRVSL